MVYWHGLQNVKLKEEGVKVVPSAKNQITSGPGLKQITFPGPQEEAWQWLTKQIQQKISVVSI